MPTPKTFESVKCSAHSKRTGAPCQRWASPGSTVCVHHGARAGQVQRKAQERAATTAVLGGLRLDPNFKSRSPAEVLRGHLAVLDELAQGAQAQVRAGAISADAIDRVVEMTKLVVQVAKITQDSGADDTVERAKAQAMAFTGSVVARILRVVTGELVDGLVPEGEHRLAVHEWTVNALVALLDGGPDVLEETARGLPPVPRRVVRLAIEAGPAA